jgi:hypothetical protein
LKCNVRATHRDIAGDSGLLAREGRAALLDDPARIPAFAN